MRARDWDFFDPKFTFNFLPEIPLSSNLSFADIPSAPPPRRLPKRTRSRADVDGEGSGHVQKKKRRLRLELITSRLSRPFATPTSHIASRGSSRIASWAKKLTHGHHPLHKLALLNSLRLGGFTIRKWPGPKQTVPSQIHVDKIIEFRRNRAESPLSLEVSPPTPKPFKGLSNYDAIDQEGDPYGDLEVFEEDDSEVEQPKMPVIVENEEDEFSMYPEYGAMEDDIGASEE